MPAKFHGKYLTWVKTHCSSELWGRHHIKFGDNVDQTVKIREKVGEIPGSRFQFQPMGSNLWYYFWRRAAASAERYNDVQKSRCVFTRRAAVSIICSTKGGGFTQGGVAANCLHFELGENFTALAIYLKPKANLVASVGLRSKVEGKLRTFCPPPPCKIRGGVGVMYETILTFSSEILRVTVNEYCKGREGV